MYIGIDGGYTERNEQGQPKLMAIQHVSKLQILRDLLAKEIELELLPAVAQKLEAASTEN